MKAIADVCQQRDIAAIVEIFPPLRAATPFPSDFFATPDYA